MELIKKFFYFALGNIFILLIGFVTTPIVTHLIVPEELGKYSLFSTVGNLCVLICMMGTDQAFVRFYYEENENARIKLAKLLMKFSVFNVFAISGIFLLGKDQISETIIGKSTSFLALGLSLFVLFNVLYSIVLLELRIEQRLNMYNILHTLQKLFYLLFAIVGIHKGIKGVWGLIVAIILSYAGSGIVGIYLEKKIWLSRQMSAIATKYRLRDMLRFGFPIFFSSIIAWVFQASDKLMLKFLSNYAELGIYSGASEIILLLNAVQAAFTTFWIPIAYEHYAKEPENTIFFTKVNQIITLFMFSVAIFLIMFKDILGVILGREYQKAVYVFPFLVFMPIMYTISETTVLGINFKKKTSYHIWIAVISATSNLILNTIFIPIYGAKGAAIATGLAYFIHWACRTIFSLKCYRVDYTISSFLTATVIIYLYAIYASFHNFGVVILLGGVCLLFVLCCLYKELLKETVHKVEEKWKK